MADTNEIVVYIHGIGVHEKGYSRPWFEALSPHLNEELSREEVLWSDTVNQQTHLAVMSAMDGSNAMNEMRVGIEAVLSDRRMQLEMEDDTPQGMGSFAVESPVQLDDFLVYMFNSFVRNQILFRFDQIVKPLLESGRKIHLIGHSWGSVVAYEGLRRYDTLRLTGEVQNLFTVGSALSISPVQSNLFERVGDGRRPECVRDWFNLDARGDFVGGRIGNAFAVNQSERLGLEPIGCSTFLGLVNPTCAHSSYFDAGNDVVNKEIFAAAIN